MTDFFRSHRLIIFMIPALLLLSTGVQAQDSMLSQQIAAIKADTDFAKPDTIHRAIQNMQDLLRLRPRSYELNWRISELYTTLARYHSPSKQTSLRLYEKAIRFARRARAIDPTHPEGHYRFAGAVGGWGLANGPLHSLHLVPQMAEAINKCTQTAPHGTSWNTVYADCIRFQARLLYEVPRFPLSIGNVNQARGLLEEAIREQPDYVDNYLYLADLEMRQNNRREVRKLLNTVTSLIRAQVTNNYQSFRDLKWSEFDIRKMRFFNQHAQVDINKLRRWIKSPAKNDR